MTLTDRAVRSALKIVPTITYFAVTFEGDLRVLFVRPWGALGQGLWIRRVLPGPAISPPWGGPS